MQTIVQVVCKDGRSLRDAIKGDVKLEHYRLSLLESKRQHRSPGWAKLKSTEGERGAINLVWSGSSRTLTCRVVTRKRNPPFNVVGDLIAYLLARHSRRILTVLISQTK